MLPGSHFLRIGITIVYPIVVSVQSLTRVQPNTAYTPTTTLRNLLAFWVVQAIFVQGWPFSLISACIPDEIHVIFAVWLLSPLTTGSLKITNHALGPGMQRFLPRAVTLMCSLVTYTISLPWVLDCITFAEQKGRIAFKLITTLVLPEDVRSTTSEATRFLSAISRRISRTSRSILPTIASWIRRVSDFIDDAEAAERKHKDKEAVAHVHVHVHDEAYETEVTLAFPPMIPLSRKSPTSTAFSDAASVISSLTPPFTTPASSAPSSPLGTVDTSSEIVDTQDDAVTLTAAAAAKRKHSTTKTKNM